MTFSNIAKGPSRTKTPVATAAVKNISCFRSKSAHSPRHINTLCFAQKPKSTFKKVANNPHNISSKKQFHSHAAPGLQPTKSSVTFNNNFRRESDLNVNVFNKTLPKLWGPTFNASGNFDSNTIFNNRAFCVKVEQLLEGIGPDLSSPYGTPIEEMPTEEESLRMQLWRYRTVEIPIYDFLKGKDQDPVDSTLVNSTIFQVPTFF